MIDPSKDAIYTSLLNENTYNTSRKNLIKLIQDKLGGKVITYIENSEHPFSSIINQDSLYFADLLQNIGNATKGFLILNSNGGSGNAAEKLLTMCRSKFTDEFTIIVPNFAKSAATMMCLGADKIMMGYPAELGPIDPQIPTAQGNIPARSFIDGLEMIRKNVKEEGDPPNMYLSMLQQIRPEIISICQSAIKDAQAFAENWLSKYMLRDDKEHAVKVASWLSDGKTYKSHGKVIGFNEAKDVLKLNVEQINFNDELWFWIWELYVRSIHYLHSRGLQAAKLYESDIVSLMMNINVGPPQKQ